MSTTQNTHKSLFSMVLAVMLFGVLFGLMGLQTGQAQAKDGDLIWRGVVEATPGDGQRIGNWTVGGEVFVANGSTEFDEEEGSLVVGACAKVKYIESDGAKIAEEIDSEPATDCDGSSGGGGGGDDDGDPLEWRGLVEATPQNGQRIGEWTVRGRVFVATSSTEFDEVEGPVQMDACVKVDYFVQDDGSFRAREIDSEPASDCGGSGGDDNGGGGDDNSDDQKRYARVDAMPQSGLVGQWTIGGTVYTADNNTYFEQEDGGFRVGACVEVEYVNGNPPVAKEIKTESSYKCDGQGSDDDDDDNSAQYPKGELYGVIRELPQSGLIGKWMIGSIAMTVTEQTRLDAEHAPFEVGVLVEAKFYTNDNDENIALKIESKYRTDDNGSDDDDNGSHEGNEGHAYGVIESIGSGTLGGFGTWIISGIDYLVSDTTRLDSGLAVGVQVKVEYYVNADKKRVAKEIETSNDDGAPSQTGHFKTYGFVDQRPAGGINGQWIIDGVTFVADQTTIIDDSRAVPVEGSYVEVEYRVENGVNKLKKIETHVPPGAGSDDSIGRLDSVGQLAASDISAGNAVWVIGGVSYNVIDATALNDSRGALTVGSTVSVNSYTDASGNVVATSVRGITLSNIIYLPGVDR
ncbi:MAG: hypothetical protein KDD84_09375 [Caldilineaceae bacterium]|nr:hypothetical protein [Caldilineaceae bacterium]